MKTEIFRKQKKVFKECSRFQNTETNGFMQSEQSIIIEFLFCETGSINII